MKEGCEKESNTFLNRQFRPNSSEENVGSKVIDRRRQIVPFVKVITNRIIFIEILRKLEKI